MHLIGICGIAHAGKDTAARIIQEYLEQGGARCRRIAFADPIKDLCTAWFGWDRDRLNWDTAYKETDFLDPDYPGNGLDPACEALGMTRRVILQRIGTEAFRQRVHPDFWTILKDLEWSNKYIEIDYGCVVDVRFHNEIQWIRRNSGILLNIVRTNSSTTAENTHQSETELDGFTDYDAVIVNPYDPNCSLIHNEETFRQQLLPTIERLLKCPTK